MTSPPSSIPIEPDSELNGVTRRKRPVWQTVIGVLVILVAFFFIGRSIWTSWETVSTYDWRFDFVWLGASAVLVWVSFFFFIWLWRFQLQTLTHRRLRFASAFRIWALSNMGKYMPGKVWAVAGMIYLLKREHFSSSHAISSSILHQAYSITASGLFVIGFLGTEILGSLPWVSLVIGAIVALIVVYPPFFTRAVNFGLRLIKREPISITITPLQAIVVFFTYLLSWIVYGVSLWTMLRGLSPTDVGLWEGSAIFVAAYLIGFLAVFAPGGLGVREGILTLLLSTHMDASLAGVVAVASRLWTSVVELLGLIPIGLGVGRPESHRAER
ncbi:MAG: hypothetical protein Kow0074_03750 [Candidatus Zixiibacteriota bacterium]